MSTCRLIILVALLSLISGCYFGITGRVIDAETNQPIEGAVVLVEWTKTKGFPGMTHTESAKVAETLSDKDGKFDLPGCYDPFVNAPDVTVYKRGYVAWNNKLIFPKYEHRTNFHWQDNIVYQLQRFKMEYAFDEHMSFVSGLVLSGRLELKTQMLQAIKWEEEKAFEERRSKK